MGGAVSWDAGAEYNSIITAIVPVSGVPKDSTHVIAKAIAQAQLPAWTFHNENDNVINPNVTKEFVQSINSFSPAIPPKFTLFKIEGHDAWTPATNPDYKENNMNIYEWMLQYSK
jgi:predicted peptidase